MEDEQDRSGELLTKRRFWLWAKKYWGGNSTGVRNWLLIAGIAVFVILLLLGPVVGPALPAAVLLGLLIGVGVIASISLAAAVIATIRAAMLDYAEYQKSPKEVSYFRHLLNKFVDWMKNHPINFVLIVALLVFAPLAAIPGLIGLSAVAILMEFGLLFSVTAITDGVCRFFDYLLSWCLGKISQSGSNFNIPRSYTSYSFNSEDATATKTTSYIPQPGSNDNNDNSVRSSPIWKPISEPLRLEPGCVAIISNPNSKKIEVREFNSEDRSLKSEKKQYDSTANEIIIPCLASKAVLIISDGDRRVIINVAKSQNDSPNAEFWQELRGTHSENECTSIFPLVNGFNYTVYQKNVKYPFRVQISSDFYEPSIQNFKFDFDRARVWSQKDGGDKWEEIEFSSDRGFYYRG